MRLRPIMAMVVVCSGVVLGQTAISNPETSDIAAELSKMREAINAQQQQILEQQKQIAEEQKKTAAQQEQIERLTQQLAARAVSQPAQAQLVDAALHTTRAASPIATQQESPQAKESPLSFRIGGTEFTPGGFIDFENVFRTTNSGSIITTNFGLIPFSNTTQ